MTLPVPPGRWSWLYPHCRDCGTSEEPHYARGYCAACYHRWHARETRKAMTREDRAKRAAYMRKWRAARKEKTHA